MLTTPCRGQFFVRSSHYAVKLMPTNQLDKDDIVIENPARRDARDTTSITQAAGNLLGGAIAKLGDIRRRR
jgi:hypothetical protein